MKTKAVQIDESIHEQLKQYCNEKGLKLQRLVEKLIIDEIKRNLQNNKSK
jgi:hypothetical protein